MRDLFLVRDSRTITKKLELFLSQKNEFRPPPLHNAGHAFSVHRMS